MAMAVRLRCFVFLWHPRDGSTQGRFLKKGVTGNPLFLVGFLFFWVAQARGGSITGELGFNRHYLPWLAGIICH
jgi:hypothetical protein